MDAHRFDSPDAGRTKTRADAPAPAAPGIVPVTRITSDQLLRGGNEVLIEHHGALYRLRQTSLGKLILTK